MGFEPGLMDGALTTLLTPSHYADPWEHACLGRPPVHPHDGLGPHSDELCFPLGEPSLLSVYPPSELRAEARVRINSHEE